MLSERSTIWANSPLESEGVEYVDKYIPYSTAPYVDASAILERSTWSIQRYTSV